MKDKRIKQLATRISLAWGLITLGFWLLDIFIVRGLLTPDINCVKASFARQAILYSIFPAAVCAREICDACFSFLFRDFPTVIVVFYIPLTLILQIALYWYFGNLTGRLIVWIKHLFGTQTSDIPNQKKTGVSSEVNTP